MRVIYFLGGALLLPFLLFCQIPYQEGFPVDINQYKILEISIADLDNDQNLEIIFHTVPAGPPDDIGGYMHVFVKNFTGEDKDGWPKEYEWCSALAISDLNDDGMQEIITGCEGIKVFNADGSIQFEIPYDGPILQSTYYATGLSIEDLDNDGKKEIVMPSAWAGALFVFEPDGSLRDGWPVLAPNVNVTDSSASIGDIDKDGLKEIILTSDKIYCFKPDGSSCPGFPFGGLRKWGSLWKALLIDANNDGYLEIIYFNVSLPPMVIMLDYQGNIVPPYPIVMSNGAFYVIGGDPNMDNRFEIFLSRYYLSGIDGYDILTAKLLPNFPILPYQDSDGLWGYGYTNLADLSDTYGEEIIAGAGNGGWVSDGKLFAFDLEGNLVEGFPSEFLYHRGLGIGCAVDDLDGDGDVEICCGSENGEFVVPAHSTLYCWDSPQPWNRDMADWMMDGFDLQNTGRWRKLYHIDKTNSHLVFEGCTGGPCILPNDGSLYAVTITAKRKFAEEYPKGQDVRLSRTKGCGEYEGPVYDNGDGTYTRFFRAPTVECTTKIEGWVNEFKLDEKAEIKFSSCLSDLGDVNLNGRISSMDVSEVLKSIVLENLDPMFRCRADVNLNGGISSMDASLILQCSVGLCNNLPAEFLTSCQSHNNCP